MSTTGCFAVILRGGRDDLIRHVGVLIKEVLQQIYDARFDSVDELLLVKNSNQQSDFLPNISPASFVDCLIRWKLRKASENTVSVA